MIPYRQPQRPECYRRSNRQEKIYHKPNKTRQFDGRESVSLAKTVFIHVPLGSPFRDELKRSIGWALVTRTHAADVGWRVATMGEAEPPPASLPAGMIHVAELQLRDWCLARAQLHTLESVVEIMGRFRKDVALSRSS